MRETIEQQVAQLVETARPTPCVSATRREEALAVMEAASRRPRRAWVWRLSAAAAATGAALIAIALLGSPAPSAWDTVAEVRDRVLAAADGAQTVHATGTAAFPGAGSPVDCTSELWADRDGFMRLEMKSQSDGQLVWLDLYNGVERLSYSRQRSDADSAAHRYWDPLMAELSRGGMQHQTKNLIGREFAMLGPPETYRRAVATRSAALDVLEVEGVAAREGGGAEAVYVRGEELRLRAEVEHVTGRLRSLALYVRRNGSWEAKTEYRYEWDVPISSELRHFETPDGALEKRYHWWDTRLGQPLRQQQTADWAVDLYAVDVNREGDVYLSLCVRHHPKESTPEGAHEAEVQVEAVDDRGTQYQQEAEYVGLGTYLDTGTSYLVVLLRPDRTFTGRSITLTAHPYAARYDANSQKTPVTPDQPVTFRLPLPVRQPGLDLPQEAIEVVQH
jgi:hypothetical protein